MAAAFGHAARRLCGSGALRRTHHAAVVPWLSPTAEQLAQRWLSPRFARTEVLHRPYICGKSDKDDTMKQIQEKKEELYDLMADAHRTYGRDHDRDSLMNKRLLEYLSEHVKPRYGDPAWRSNLESNAIGEYIGNIGLVTFCVGVWMMLMNMMLLTLSWLRSL